MRRWLVLLLTTVGAAMPVVRPLGQPSQSADQSVGFEVASINPTSRLDFGLRRPPSPDRFLRQSITLSDLLGYAYDVSAFQVEDGDEWTRTSRFDVEAKAAERPTADQMRTMVKRLLAERFHLKVHTVIDHVERPTPD